MNITKIIIITTSHLTMGTPDLTSEPTGVWFEELATPYYHFIDAGFEVDVASIKGGAIPIDPRSQKTAGKNKYSVEQFMKDAHSMTKITNSLSIEGINLDEYDAIFFPGGHGTMWDFPNNKKLSQVIANALENQRVVAAVCHGPAVFVGATYSDGNYIVKNKQVTGFTNTEENTAGLSDVVPFLLEDELIKAGANYLKGPNFEPFAVQDGNLITGQNPASSDAVARLVVNALLTRSTESKAINRQTTKNEK